MNKIQLEAKKNDFELTINATINFYEGKIDNLREAMKDLKVIGNVTDLKEFIDKWKGQLHLTE